MLTICNRFRKPSQSVYYFQTPVDMNSKERMLWLEIRRKISGRDVSFCQSCNVLLSENEICEAELRLDKQREQGLLDSQKQQLIELETST